jgi:flagellar hook-basal body complex protein FliE
MITDPITGFAMAAKGNVISPTRAAGPAMPAGAASRPGSPDFADLLGAAFAGTAQQLRQAEAVSLEGVVGRASTQDVVEQVMAAEQALQASIAIRDKVISAYLEISRMAI